MTLYRDMTTPQLAQHGLQWRTCNPHEHRMVRALASQLEKEYQRAEEHRERLGHFQHCLNTNQPGPGYIKVAKPHIRQVFTEPGGRGMWRCTGPFGTVQYGETPAKAYAAWRRVMERGKVWRN